MCGWTPQVRFNKEYIEERVGEVLHSLVQDGLKLPDDGGGIPKFEGRGWRFESRL
jgi:hypothetical protein